jgi:uncharacterized protein
MPQIELAGDAVSCDGRSDFRMGPRFAIAIAIAMSAITALACSSRFAGASGVAYVFMLGYGALALGAVFSGHRGQLLGKWMRVRSGDLTFGVALAAFAMLGAWALMRWVAMPGTRHEGWVVRVYFQLGDPSWMRSRLPAVLAGISVCVVSEELIWRGWVTSLLQQRFGLRYAWIVAAGGCAVAHLPAAWVLRDPDTGLNALVILAALGTGILWGAVTQVSGRLVPAMLGHTLFSIAAALLFRLWGPSL